MYTINNLTSNNSFVFDLLKFIFTGLDGNKKNFQKMKPESLRYGQGVENWNELNKRTKHKGFSFK